MNKGTWLTNNPKTMKSWYPRRAVMLYEGDPKATDTYTVEELKKQGLVGIYLGEDLNVDIKSLHMCRSHVEWLQKLEERGVKIGV